MATTAVFLSESYLIHRIGVETDSVLGSKEITTIVAQNNGRTAVAS